MVSAGRDELLDSAGDLLATGRPALLLGEIGMGKSFVIDALEARLDDEVYVVAGRDSVAGVALVPVAPLIAAVGDPGSPLDVYTVLPARLRRTGARVLVDDAHLVDRATAVLLAQLARAGVPILLAAPAVSDLADALRDLALRRRWDCLRLDPLDADALLSMAAGLLGGDLTAGAGAHLLSRAEGNPGVVVALASTAVVRTTAGGLEVDWPRSTPTLQALFSDRLAALSDAEAEALGIAAAAGRLPFDRCDPRLSAALAARALVRIDDGVLQPASPLLGDVVLDRVGTDVRARWLSAAAQILAGAGEEWQPRRVLLRVRVGEEVTSEELRGAAGKWLSEHRPAEADEVLSAVTSGDGEGPSSGPWFDLLRGAAAAARGDYGAAVHLLEGAAASGLSEPAFLGRLGAELGRVHAVGLTDPARAVEAVSEIAGRMDESTRAALDGDLVKWHLMAGLPAPSLPGAERAADEAGRLGVLIISAMIAALDGTAAEACADVDAGLALVGSVGESAPYAVDLLRLSRYLANAFEGRIPEAERDALAHREEAARAGHPALGMWEYATAELGLHSGRLAWSSALASRAVRHLAWRDFTGLAVSATALRAAVDARRGRMAIALHVVDEIGAGALGDVKVALHVARVRSEALRLGGDPSGAAAVLVEVARRAVAESHRHLGVLALDEAWMLDGGEGVVDELASLASSSPLASAFHARCESARAADPAALVAVADRLAEMGLPGRAVHALQLAERFHRRARRAAEADRLARRAAVLLADTATAAWPRAATVAALTARELEIARLAAERVRSREIASVLGVSVRTIDNHLGRIFRKLGVAGRDQLAAALGLDPVS